MCVCVLHLCVCAARQGSVYAYKSGKHIDDPFTPDTRISEQSWWCWGVFGAREQPGQCSTPQLRLQTVDS